MADHQYTTSPRPLGQPGMEHYEGTPGLEVVGQDMDNSKSNLTPPPGMVGYRDDPQQPPSQGYFAPAAGANTAQSIHPGMVHNEGFASRRQQGTVDSYGTGPVPHATGATYYQNGGNQHLDPNRATITSHGGSMAGGPMSDAGLTYSASMSEKRHHDRQRTVCGVFPATFFLSLALAAVVLIAAIGGGVGGTMAVKEARTKALEEAALNCSAKATATAGTQVTTTNDAGAAVTSTSSQKFKNPGQVITELDCPGMDGRNMVINMRGKEVTFTPQCGTDYYINQEDMISTVAYSFENCVRACAAMNSYTERNKIENMTCIAVVFNANMLSNVDTHGGNCWLKRKIGEAKTTPGLDTVAAALLVKK